MNQLPTTIKQINVYKVLKEFNVEYMLIGSLATMFYGRNRSTDDIDLLVKDSQENGIKLIKALKSIGYNVEGLKENDLKKYENLTLAGETILDLYSEYNGITYEDVEYRPFSYGEIVINVVTKEDLIRLLATTGLNSEDVEVLNLLDDPVRNKDEINDRQ